MSNSGGRTQRCEIRIYDTIDFDVAGCFSGIASLMRQCVIR